MAAASRRRADARRRGAAAPQPPLDDSWLCAPHAGREVILGVRPEAITDRDGADRNARTCRSARLPGRGRRARRRRHLCGDASRRREVVGAHARRPQVRAGTARCPSPSTSKRPCCSTRNRPPDRSEMGDAPDMLIIGAGMGGARSPSRRGLRAAVPILIERGGYLRASRRTRVRTPFSAAALPLGEDVDGRARAARSIPASTTMSAATPRSTARR